VRSGGIILDDARSGLTRIATFVTTQGYLDFLTKWLQWPSGPGKEWDYTIFNVSGGYGAN